MPYTNRDPRVAAVNFILWGLSLGLMLVILPLAPTGKAPVSFLSLTFVQLEMFCLYFVALLVAVGNLTEHRGQFVSPPKPGYFDKSVAISGTFSLVIVPGLVALICWHIAENYDPFNIS